MPRLELDMFHRYVGECYSDPLQDVLWETAIFLETSKELWSGNATRVQYGKSLLELQPMPRCKYRFARGMLARILSFCVEAARRYNRTIPGFPDLWS